MSYFKQSLITLIILLFPVLSIAQTCQTASIPNNQFKDNGNGTITDTKTGLMWKKCSEGQTGNNCEGAAQKYSWKKALAQSQTVNQTGFANYKDWRVPNAKELYSIAEEKCINPAINTTIFPNTPPLLFWSSSSNASNSYDAWDVNFYYGYSDTDFKDYNYHVRLVRSGQ